MISDILCETLELIRTQRANYPEVYSAETGYFVDQVVQAMSAVAHFLDWPPGIFIHDGKLIWTAVPAAAGPELFDEGIGWCIYCGSSDLQDEMKPSEMYKEHVGIEALCCSKCYPLEKLLLAYREDYRRQQWKTE